MGAPQKILLIDDDQKFLDTLAELLSKVASEPEVRCTSSGQRALSLLEAEVFNLAICDLKMARMDGLQVVAVLRRRYPQLRTVVMTGLADEQLRARAYALGVDLFLQKPGTPEESKLFVECLESLLGRENTGGFRGIQSKTLVDIVQLECLSQSSSVLRIVEGTNEGKIWFTEGELIDAVTGDLAGEAALRRILTWKNGNFEVLQPDPRRPRAIYNNYQTLLLENAQMIDESASSSPAPAADAAAANGKPGLALLELTKFRGVEFIVACDGPDQYQAWGVENAPEFSAWARKTMDRFHKLGETLHLGQLRQVEGSTSQRHIAIVCRGAKEICVGLQRSLSPDQVRQTMKNILAKWAF